MSNCHRKKIRKLTFRVLGLGTGEDMPPYDGLVMIYRYRDCDPCCPHVEAIHELESNHELIR